MVPNSSLCSLLQLSLPELALIYFSSKNNKKIPLHQLLSALPPLAFGYIRVSRHLLVELPLPSNPRPLQRIFFLHWCPHPYRSQGAHGWHCQGQLGTSLCVDECQLLSRMPGLQQLEAEVAICVLTWKGRHPLIPCRAAEKPAPGFFPRNLTSP